MYVRSLATAALTAALMLTAVPAHAEEDLATQVSAAFRLAASQVAYSEKTLPARRYPNYTLPAGPWHTTGAGGWTSGFFPGSEWLLYQAGANSDWRKRALSRQAAIRAERFDSGTHDLGFKFGPSFVAAYRLTGDAAHRDVALTAARSLSKRYDRRVGMIRSRNTDEDFHVIVDSMMNLELLFWAADNGGSPWLRERAIKHALGIRKDFVRADGSTYQLVVYDSTNGAVKSKGTRQGSAPETTWSRGQAWAVYGFTMAYRETRDPRFLETARACADYYIANLPADAVPYWDFQAPAIPDEPRDSSAAAAAASGLAELSLLEHDSLRRDRYASAAQKTLASLCSPSYLSTGTAVPSVLLHGTVHRPAGLADSGVVFGDYYLLEAMLRLRRLPAAEATLPVTRVRASKGTGSNRPANVLDSGPSRYGTRWSAYGRGEWIEFDLGAPKQVDGVGLAVWRGGSRSATFRIQVSSDRKNWRTVKRAMSSGRTTRPELYSFASTQARYVRITCLGTTRAAWNRLTDARVYSAGR